MSVLITTLPLPLFCSFVSDLLRVLKRESPLIRCSAHVALISVQGIPHTFSVYVLKNVVYKRLPKRLVTHCSKVSSGFEGDELWSMSDQELIALGKGELSTLGLADACNIEDGLVVRVPKAYPIYDSRYQESLRIIYEFINQINNLQLVGRNGMHKYNNQDHSMLTAMLAVENILRNDTL